LERAHIGRISDQLFTRLKVIVNTKGIAWIQVSAINPRGAVKNPIIIARRQRVLVRIEKEKQ
jgi:hypothetical protein